MNVEQAQSAPSPEELNRLVALFQAGRHAELESQARLLLARHPQAGFVWKLLSAALHLQGKDSYEALQKASACLPEDAELHSNLGNVLRECGQVEQAVASYQRALSLRPDLAEAHYNLGVAWKDLGKPEAAAVSYRRALELKPDYAEAWNNLGVVLMEMGLHEEAAASYRRVLQLQPNHTLAHNNLGNALHAQGRFDEAVACYRLALELDPGYAEACRNLGNVLRDLGQFEAAAASYSRALALRPDHARTLYGLALTLQDIGRLDEAVEYFQRALASDPDCAEAHLGLSFALLTQKKFAPGWKEYEWRWQCMSGELYAEDPCEPGKILSRPSSYLPVIFAERKFLLIADQGIGDELFFLRFAPEIRRRGGWLAYRPSRKLRSLLARCRDLDQLVGANECLPEIDYKFLVGEAALVLGMTSVDDLPPPLLLETHPEQIKRMRPRIRGLGNGPFLGVTWRAGTPPEARKANRKFQFREIPFTELAVALRKWPGQILVLQRNLGEGELAAFSQAFGRPCHNFSGANENLEEMLALLSLLDDHVGVSNTNMHLCAGLGKPCRVMVPSTPDWRWTGEDGRSPWFPGFRLYRQGRHGSWKDALDQLSHELLDGVA
jgi:tetratricopeptide (TPR) repeat protein